MDEEQSLAGNYDNSPPSECDLWCSSNINALVTLHVASFHFLGAPLWKKHVKIRFVPKTCKDNVRTASKQCHFYSGRSEYGRTPAKSKLQHDQMNIRARATEKGYCFATKNGKTKLTAQEIDRN